MVKPIHRFEVFTRHADAVIGTGQVNNLTQSFSQLNIHKVTGYRVARLYFLCGEFTISELHEIAKTYLADAVTEDYFLTDADTPQAIDAFQDSIEVTTLPGVTNSVADNLSLRLKNAGIGSIEWAATGTRHLLAGDLSQEDLQRLAERLFANVVIHHYSINQAIMPSYIPNAEANSLVDEILICAVDDEQLLEISQERKLSLNLEEMQAIRAYYESEERNPTDLELEMLAQTWSEHCVHKTFRATIDYQGPDGQETIHGLLKTYIRGATDKLDKSWLRSVFVDNAGILRFDDEYDIAFKVETHNHPSAIEPFGGANTGVGGVVRDILGVSAKPIANTDILCFGFSDTPIDEIPDGTLHPSRIAEGVIDGVEDYGNKMGIPTVNGAVLYHEGYTANPLVFCGCLGILPHGSHRIEPQAGDYIIVIGGHTGRDGLRGATFSSMEMDATSGTVAGSSVQIGNPITEKQVQEVIIQARDKGLYTAITDCGAGGLSSAVGEMAKEIGARVQLRDIPLKYSGLQPWEIWLSEAQERMVLAVSPENWEALQTICVGQDVSAVNIGTFTGTGHLHIFDGDSLVGDLSMDFLHEGIPTHHLQAVWQAPTIEENPASETSNFSDALLKLLAHPNIRSKENIVRRYDHEVQGGSTVKPFGGVNLHGHNDGSVLVPIGTQKQNARGVVLSNGVCPQYTELDPYAMAWAAVDEAMRNAVAVGADPDQIAILDNFCWGNPKLPDRLGSLVRCVQGCYDAALAYGTPYISGKDSLNNEYTDSKGNRHAIPGTLLISAVGIVPDVSKTTTSDLKKAGNYLYVIGDTRAELGGSHFSLITGDNFGTVPQPVDHALDIMRTLYQSIQAGYIQACHDVSEGGIALALAEMAIGGELSFYADMTSIANLNDDEIAFSESLTRFIVEVAPEDTAEFERLYAGKSLERIASVQSVNEPIEYKFADKSYSFSLADLYESWKGEAYVADAPLPDTSYAIKFAAPVTLRHKPRALILHANGSNRDHDVALACAYAGAEPEIVHINQMRKRERQFADYDMLVIPGGFSYGDDLGAGRLWAIDLRQDFSEEMDAFVSAGKPVIGICNGFQTLVKSGLLPGDEFTDKVTLTYNASEQFECRWVYLEANPHSPSLFTRNLTGLIYCPVAHGEGRVMMDDDATSKHLQELGLVALSYVNADASVAQYPANPNGSIAGIAGLSNAAGNVFGLMPHPENHIFDWQHPRYHRGESGMLGLSLFINGVCNA